jgi:hypothetical protein
VEAYPCLTAGGEEKRIMMARDWFVARIEESVFSSMINDDLHAFDNETLTLIEGLIRAVCTEALDRRIIVDTAERPLVIDMPDADSFTAAERASHKAELINVFSCYINSAINDYKITGTWSL